MSRENTSPLPHGDGEGRCLTSSPCAALLWSVALRGIPVHQLLRSSCRAGAPASSVAAMWQPWFYLRLEDEKEARRCMSPRLPTFVKKGAKVRHPPLVSVDPGSKLEMQWPQATK